jgi:hypothetical protein
MQNSIDQQDYEELAKTRGFVFIGPMPKNTKTKTTWQCQHNHRWLSKMSNVQSGSGCPYCANEKRWELKTSVPWTDKARPAPNKNLTAGDYHAAGQSVGYSWIGSAVPLSTKHPTTWRCQLGHEWEAPYTNLVFSGSGCPYCANEKRRNMDDDYRRIGLRHSLNYIGPLPKNSREKTWWACQAGHHFQKRLSAIQCGEGCPCCAKLLYPKHRGTGIHVIILCDGLHLSLDTLIEAQYEKDFLDTNGCRAHECHKNHLIRRL